MFYIAHMGIPDVFGTFSAQIPNTIQKHCRIFLIAGTRIFGPGIRPSTLARPFLAYNT